MKYYDVCTGQGILDAAPNTLRVATTALESIPRRHDTEVAESNGDVKAICDAVYNSTKPVNNTSLPPRYRRNMIKVLIKRACEE